MNARLAFLVLGAVIGAVIGWLTAPQKVLDVTVGNVNITATENNGAVSVGKGGVFDDPLTRTLIFAAIGGVVGLGAGVVAGNRRG